MARLSLLNRLMSASASEYLEFAFFHLAREYASAIISATLTRAIVVYSEAVNAHMSADENALAQCLASRVHLRASTWQTTTAMSASAHADLTRAMLEAAWAT